MSGCSSMNHVLSCFQVSCSCENLDKREEAEPKEEEEEQVVTIRQLWRPDDVIDRCDSEKYSCFSNDFDDLKQ